LFHENDDSKVGDVERVQYASCGVWVHGFVHLVQREVNQVSEVL